MRLPRTRGDGPITGTTGRGMDSASPHTRGWTLVLARRNGASEGFPAHAGMDRRRPRTAARRRRLPRTRGDGPEIIRSGGGWRPASPHTRGWTRNRPPARRNPPGFPAHAGMDPMASTRRQFMTRLPRTRGDGPEVRGLCRSMRQASPHTRGWTRHDRLLALAGAGFPAHAGMDPPVSSGAAGAQRLPRTRGDGPCSERADGDGHVASPHTRGWTRHAGPHQAGKSGFPAHAGMDPRRHRTGRTGRRLPRTRGDGPRAGHGGPAGHEASPHTRGWTWIARAHMEVAMASPHTRGWTVEQHPGGLSVKGFPAHAGMDPQEEVPQRRGLRLPRTRGDGPSSGVGSSARARASPHTRGWTCARKGEAMLDYGFPAHAGMDRGARTGGMSASRLPRTRGDGPGVWSRGCSALSASPHTRGWTPRDPALVVGDRGFPAHAGMDPRPGRPAAARAGLPRTRGDGPYIDPATGNPARASPHTRGWTRPRPADPRPGDGFPAHAGMDPLRGRSPPAGRWLPRTRGDGPSPTFGRAGIPTASPHTRGWTLQAHFVADYALGFPAHAGMDPEVPRASVSR